MKNRWTYRVPKDEQANPRYGDFIVSMNGHIAGRVTWVVMQENIGAMHWRAIDGQHGFVRKGKAVDAAQPIRETLTKTRDQQNRDWHDKLPG